MNINEIRLPEHLIAELYRSSLIDTGENPAKATESGLKDDEKLTSEWKTLGNNQKNVLVMVNEAGTKVLPAKQLNFLTAMLTACKLSIDDIIILNRSHHPDLTYKQPIDKFKSRIVFLFDIEPAEFGLPMSFPHYQLQAFANATFLYAPSLTELENDKLQKSKLWVSLKRLFNL